jgi:hypothetical protein
MQERPGKSFGPKLTPKSLSDDVAISPPIDFFFFFHTTNLSQGPTQSKGDLNCSLHASKEHCKY